MEKSTNLQEMALGLLWRWDELGYRLRLLESQLSTLRNIHCVPAAQYDPPHHENKGHYAKKKSVL